MPLHPELTNTSAPLLDEVEVFNELGCVRRVYIPGECLLTVCFDKHELVTLMTLGGAPEVLMLGYLRDQRLASSIEDITSIQVDWKVESAAVPTCAGIADLGKKTVRRTMTIGCRQGTIFDSLMDEIDAIHLSPDARMTQITLYRAVGAVYLQQSIYRQAGSVHSCASFDACGQLLYFIEDAGRHNAVNVVADRVWLEGMEGGDRIFYIIGRLASEVVIKGAQMSIPFLLSHSGVMQTGHQMVQRVNLTLFARCVGRCFLLCTGRDRSVAGPKVAGMVGPYEELLQAAESDR